MKKLKAKVKTLYGVYDISLEKDGDTFVVTAPKVAGMVTWGNTQAEAKLRAVEAIECAIEGKIIIAVADAGYITIHKNANIA